MPISTKEEFAILEARVLALANQTIPSGEVLGILRALESLLPRVERTLIEPATLDLKVIGEKPQIKIMRCALDALCDLRFYNANTRYPLVDWIAILRNVSSLSEYLQPPTRLGYAAELCGLALRTSDELDRALTLNLLFDFDPRAVRQLISPKNVSQWANDLVDRLEELCSQGDDFESIEGVELDDPSIPEDFDRWSREADRMVLVAGRFFRSWNRAEPKELAELVRLHETVERPMEPPEPEADDDERPTTGASEFWTLDRIFEDL